MSGAAQPYAFKDPALLRRALTIPEPNQSVPDNQRLEFLGDAVLELLVSERLYRLHPEADEGRLTAMRTALVSTTAIAARLPRLGAWFESAFRRYDEATYHNLGKARVDAFEALVGAAWLDGGRPAAESFVATLYREEDFLAERVCADACENPKGALQAFVQRNHLPLPVYRVLGKAGPLHAPLFRVSAECVGLSAEGEGPSIKKAEAAAARGLLARLTEETP